MTPVRLAATGLATALALAGCSTSKGAAGGSGAPGTSAFKAAQTAFDTARTAALTDLRAVTDTASAVDRMEPAAAKGDVDGMRTLAPAARTGADAVAPVLARLATDADGYDRAVTGLETASASFDGRSAQAVATLVAAARAESTATRAVATALGGGWPGYQGLEDVGQLWLTRAVAGYYPDPEKGGYSASIAGSNFQIMLEPHTADLTTERNALGTAVAGLDTAKTSAALTAVTAALNG